MNPFICTTSELNQLNPFIANWKLNPFIYTTSELNQQLREATGCSRGTQQAAASKQTQHQQPAPAPTRCSSGCQRTSHWNSCDAAAAKPAAATRTHATQQHRTQLSHLNPLTQTSSKPSPTPPQVMYDFSFNCWDYSEILRNFKILRFLFYD